MEEFKHAVEGAIGIYFYSDNLYLFEKKHNDITMLSMDGEKMECSHDNLDALFYQEEIIKSYKKFDPETKGVFS
jgi:hypothetical protein